MANQKQTNLSHIVLDFEIEGEAGYYVIVDQEAGTIKFFDSHDNEIQPKSSSRSVYYERASSKLKFRSIINAVPNQVSVDGYKTFAELDSFFVIDTNTLKNGPSVSSWLHCKLINTNGKYELKLVSPYLYFFEFIGIPTSVNPELVGIYTLTNMILNNEQLKGFSNIAILNDSELNSQQNFNNGSMPIFQNFYLPPSIKLHYASADTGNEFTNKLIKLVDAKAKNHLQQIQQQGYFCNHIKLSKTSDIQYGFTQAKFLEFEAPLYVWDKLKDNDFQIQFIK